MDKDIIQMLSTPNFMSEFEQVTKKNAAEYLLKSETMMGMMGAPIDVEETELNVKIQDKAIVCKVEKMGKTKSFGSVMGETIGVQYSIFTTDGVKKIEIDAKKCVDDGREGLDCKIVDEKGIKIVDFSAHIDFIDVRQPDLLVAELKKFCHSTSRDYYFDNSIDRKNSVNLVFDLLNKYAIDNETTASLSEALSELQEKNVLMNAVERGDADQVRDVAQAGRVGLLGDSEIFGAVINGHADMVKALAELGADLEANKEGLTPVMVAASMGHTDTVVALAELGANLEAKEKHGMTAVILAASEGHTDTVVALAELGANLDAKDESGCTSMMRAAFAGHTDTVVALAKHGANLEANIEGITAVRLAASKGHTDTVEALEKLGVKVDARTKGILKKKRIEDKKNKYREVSNRLGEARLKAASKLGLEDVKLPKMLAEVEQKINDIMFKPKDKSK